MSVADHEQIAALREEIRRAGSGVRRLRLALGWGIFLPVALLILLGALFVAFLAPIGPDGPDQRTLELYVARDAVLCLVISSLVTFLVALLVAAERRDALSWRLRQLVRSVERSRRAEALLPLRSERLGDTLKILAPLLREFGPPREFSQPSELAPAGVPEARGDEASPAEGAP